MPPVSWPALLLAAAVVVAATAGVYWNSLGGAFVLDDHAWILDNASITRLANLGEVLFPTDSPAVAGRPIVSLTLAVNYALGGLNPVGYHVVNVVIHALAALVLLGVVRRTLLSPRMGGRFAQTALPLAAAVGLVWAVHPLTTAAVTYVIQRTESLAALFYLLTVYCTIRGATVANAARSRAVAWYVAAAAACAGNGDEGNRRDRAAADFALRPHVLRRQLRRSISQAGRLICRAGRQLGDRRGAVDRHGFP